MGSERVFLTVSIKNPPPGGERRRGEKEKRRRGKKNITRAEAESRARPKAEVPPVQRRRLNGMNGMDLFSLFLLISVVRCELGVCRVSVAVEKCQDDAVGHSRALPGVILGQDLESPADFATGTTLL